MKRSLFALASVSLLGFVWACNPNGNEEPENVNSRNQSAQVQFIPACGNPGQLVQIMVNTDSCLTAKTSVEFTGGGSNRAVVGGESRDYTLGVAVPANATTGTVTIHGCGNLVDEGLASTSVFTIPCPPDAGAAETGTQVAPPVGGSLKVGMNQSAGEPTPSYGGGGEFRLGTAEQLERIARTLESYNAPIASIPMGTCADDPRVRDYQEAEGVKPIDVGAKIDLLQGGSVLASFDRRTNLAYSYPSEGPFPFGTTADVKVLGSMEVPGGTLMGAMRFARDIRITSPEFAKSGTNSYPVNGFALTWESFEAQSLYVDFVLGGKVGKVCRLDPKSGAFTIPASAFEAAKMTALPTIIMQVNAEEQNRVPVKIAGEDRSFILETDVCKTITFSKMVF